MACAAPPAPRPPPPSVVELPAPSPRQRPATAAQLDAAGAVAPFVAPTASSEALRQVVVFFPFDSAALTRASVAALGPVADELRVTGGWPSVRVAGHCDERGSTAYNIALGQRRADAVKRVLRRLGVRSSQVSTVSCGSERPAAAGHDEDAWARNRRAEVSR